MNDISVRVYIDELKHKITFERCVPKPYPAMIWIVIHNIQVWTKFAFFHNLFLKPTEGLTGNISQVLRKP